MVLEGKGEKNVHTKRLAVTDKGQVPGVVAEDVAEDGNGYAFSIGRQESSGCARVFATVYELPERGQSYYPEMLTVIWQRYTGDSRWTVSMNVGGFDLAEGARRLLFAIKVLVGVKGAGVYTFLSGLGVRVVRDERVDSIVPVTDLADSSLCRWRWQHGANSWECYYILADGADDAKRKMAAYIAERGAWEHLTAFLASETGCELTNAEAPIVQYEDDLFALPSRKG
jgi:hypothetical protein